VPRQTRCLERRLHVAQAPSGTPRRRRESRAARRGVRRPGRARHAHRGTSRRLGGSRQLRAYRRPDDRQPWQAHDNPPRSPVQPRRSKPHDASPPVSESRLDNRTDRLRSRTARARRTGLRGHRLALKCAPRPTQSAPVMSRLLTPSSAGQTGGDSDGTQERRRRQDQQQRAWLTLEEEQPDLLMPLKVDGASPRPRKPALGATTPG
jgi:hypothetical protein